jgi:hypothetical protein
MLEAFIVRAKMIRRTTPPGETSGARVLLAAYPQCPLLADIEELFVLRDVIAHNHV